MSKDFESMMSELESIVKQLDNENVTLEHSIELYEAGVKLSKACQDQLKEAEKKIASLQEDPKDE